MAEASAVSAAAAATATAPAAAALKESYAITRKSTPWCTGGRLQLTADGATLFTMCGDRVNAIDTASAQLIHSFEGDSEPVMAMQLTPDGQTLAASSRSLMLRLWDWQERRLLRAFKAHNGPVVAMDFDSTSTLLATGSADSTAKVWDIRKGYCTHNFRGSLGVVSMVQFGPESGDKITLFTCSDDNLLREWSLQSSKLLRTFKGHVGLVRQLAFNGPQEFISASRDKVMLAWDRRKVTVKNTITAFEVLEAVVNHPGSSSDQWQVVTAGHKGVLRLWDVASGKCIREQSAPSAAEPPAIRHVLFNTAASSFLSLTFDQQILQHCLDTLEPNRRLVAHHDEILDLKFVGPQQRHVALASNSSEILVLHQDTMDTLVLAGHKDMVLCLDVSSDGRFLASCSKDQRALLWMLEDTPRASQPPGKRKQQKHKDADKSAENEAERLSVTCVAECVGHAQSVTAVALSRRSNAFVVTASEDTTLKVWDLASLEQADSYPHRLRARYTVRAHEKDITSLCVAPNDKIMASGSQDRTVKLWNVADGQEAGVLRGHKRGVWSIQFSPVDQVLASASGDATVRVWSLADHSCIRSFEGHTNSVLKLAFVTRGMQLLSSGSDGLVKLWNLKTGDSVCTLDAHEDKVWALAVPQGQDDGGVCVSGSADGTLVFWKDDTVTKQEERQAALAEETALAQQLDNLVREKQLAAAFKLAIKLKKPRVMLKLVRGLVEAHQLTAIEDALRELNKDQLAGTLGFIVEWNTNARFSDMAQVLLEAVLKSVPPAKLASLPDARKLLDALSAYSERHYRRMDKLEQQTALLEYTWQAARSWAGGSAAAAISSLPETTTSEEKPATPASGKKRAAKGSGGSARGKKSKAAVSENGDADADHQMADGTEA